MKKYNVILFDLDGTITDPGEGITNSVAYALRKFGIENQDRRELYRFIGPPLAQSFQEFYQFTEEKAYLAVEYYREYYKEKGIFENELYQGFQQLLIKLHKEGKKLLVATSKPEIFATQILEYFHVAQYFTYIGGSNLDGSRTDKAEVIEYVMKSCEIKDKQNVVMVGDRKFDILGAKTNGLDSIGVLFGYGEKEELINAGADYIVESVLELEKLFI